MKRILASVVVLAAIVGCGHKKIVPVSGVVKLNGKPYKNAVVSFQPLGTKAAPEPGRGSAGVTDDDGRYTLTYDGERPGALVGKHRVRIFTKSGAEPPPDDSAESTPGSKAPRFIEPIPAEWNERSTKEFDVPQGGTDTADFDIPLPTKPGWKK